MKTHAVLVRVADQPGMLYRLTKVFADHQVNITHVDLHAVDDVSELYFEVKVAEGALDRILADLGGVPGVQHIEETPSFGRRSTASASSSWAAGRRSARWRLGAISEADRHNIRGEHISVDTIPLVGEQPLAAAVRAVVRLPRVKMLWSWPAPSWAAISRPPSRKCGGNGLFVISLNMAGSVPDAADLVVTDPVQAGVMAVMAVADTAKFDLLRQLKRKD